MNMTTINMETDHTTMTTTDTTTTTETKAPARPEKVPGVNCPNPGQTWAEWEETKPKKQKRARAKRRPLSEKQRAALLSPENLARLRGQLDANRAAKKGKVPTRRGVPCGWGTQKMLRARADILREAEAAGMRAVERLVEHGVIDHHAAGNLVLAHMISLVVAADGPDGTPAFPAKVRLSAAQLVLEYTMPKPVKKADALIVADAFLRRLLEEEPGGKGAVDSVTDGVEQQGGTEEGPQEALG